MFADAFCIAAAKCPAEGITFQNGMNLPSDQVTANHCPKRLLLGTKEGHSAHWFKFNSSRHELRTKDQFSFMTMYEDTMLKYKKISDDIVELIETQAEPWWRDSKEWWPREVPAYYGMFFDIQRLMSKRLYG